MSNVDWVSLVSVITSWTLVLVIFLGRNWLKARIEKGVQYKFDKRIENLRTELRKNEESFKTDLRNKETEITLLRNAVLSGSASRQSLLDRRRFDAVEKVWTAVNDLAQLKGLSAMMAIVNFKEVAKEAGHPKMQQFLAFIGTGAPDAKDLKNVARDERPFLPELAWAYFSAYTTILYGSLARYTVLKIGMNDADRYLTNEPAKKILKAVLPHQSQFIDEQEPGSYHYLLEEIEGYLLAELRKILEGKDADQAAAARAKEIMEAVRLADQEQKKETVAAAGMA